MATTPAFAPDARLTLPALLGYLFPALAMLPGAALGAVTAPGGDAPLAVGAIAGFLAALVVARIAIGLPARPQPIPVSRTATTFPQE